MHDVHAPLDPDLLAAWLDGDMSTQLSGAVERWAGDDPQRHAWLAAMRRSHDVAGTMDTALDLERLEQRVAARIREQDAHSRARATAWPGRSWIRWTAIATTLILAVPAVLLWQRSRHSANAPLAVEEYHTAPGERLDVALSDGTRVLLNVASTLRVPANFGDGARVVQLDGEAQFVVTHDANRPFSVEADGTVVRDLATTFVVRAYRGSATQVAVRDGRVSVQAPNVTSANAVSLDAGKAARVHGDGAVRVFAADNASFAWTAGRLVLRDLPLGTALHELKRWYGLDFRVSDSSLLTPRINATLPATLDPYALEGLADVAGARIEHRGDVVTFVPKGR